MKFVITITARMKSKRLPLKVMRYLKGKPMIEHMIDRLQLSRLANDIVLCTSSNPQDDILIDVAEKKELKCYRGSEEDVLLRIFEGAKCEDADYMINVTADNPLVDHEHIDRMIEIFKKINPDYITCMHLPLGAYGWGLNMAALERFVKTKKNAQTECWGLLIEEDKNIIRHVMEVDEELRHPEIRITVDTQEDLMLMKMIFDRFYIDKNDFPLKAIVEFILNDERVFAINKSVPRGDHQKL